MNKLVNDRFFKPSRFKSGTSEKHSRPSISWVGKWVWFPGRLHNGTAAGPIASELLPVFLPRTLNDTCRALGGRVAEPRGGAYHYALFNRLIDSSQPHNFEGPSTALILQE
jgi:hypothetical protein